LYSAIQRSIGVGWAVLIVTALFAGVHFWQYWGSPGTIILICLLSLILTLIRVRTNNLLPCVVLHTIFNGLQSLSLIFFEDFSSTQPKTEAFFHLIK
jgi:membrane protease YdiL (CAAX protease family)